MIQELKTILMFVEDVTASSNFYGKLLNLEPCESGPSFCSFKLGDQYFNFHPVDRKSPLSKGGSVGYWLVDNFEAFVQRACSMGATVYRGPLFLEEIGRHICQLEDPFGNIIGIEGE